MSQHLTTGWEPVDLPVGDTVVRRFWHAMLRERLLAEPGLVSGSVFSDDSRPGIERLGYLPVSRFTLWRRTFGASTQ